MVLGDELEAVLFADAAVAGRAGFEETSEQFLIVQKKCVREGRFVQGMVLTEQTIGSSFEEFAYTLPAAQFEAPRRMSQ